MGETQEPPRGEDGESPPAFAAGWKGGLVSDDGKGREVICSPVWARNAKLTPYTLVSGVLKAY